MDGWESLPAARVGSWALVTLPTEIDITCARLVADDLEEALTDRVCVLVVDMRDTTFCDVSGARTLVMAQRSAAAQGAEVWVVAPGPQVRRLFSLLRIEEVLRVYQTLGAAFADNPCVALHARAQ